MLQIGDSISEKIEGIIIKSDNIVQVLDNKDTSSCVRTSIYELSKEQTLILYFYPKDSTPGCTIEANQFQKFLPEFQKLDTLVVGCSRDNEKKHCQFMKKQELSFPLLYDHDGSITEFFGVWGEKSFMGKKYMGISRVTYIIQKGKVIQFYPKVKVKEHAKEVLEYIQSL